MTESRLDRLLKLLDTAQSPAYRRLAAKQLGNLIKSRPSQVRSLLQMLDSLLFSKNWDTRIATGYAIEYIFKALPNQFTDLYEPLRVFDNKNDFSTSQLLKEMDLTVEIKSRKALLASAGAEFDLDLTISAAERLRISRVNMKKTLGLDEISGMDDLEKELVKDEDLVTENVANTVPLPSVDLEKLSARERIAMKRKARLKPQSQAPPLKQVKKEKTNEHEIENFNSTASLESEGVIESDALWLCERMKEKLLNPNWQIRHGALLGLRGILNCGLPIILCQSETSETQDEWIDFLLCDILLILGLDRFGDFIGDQVVSPVKETAALLLALVYKRINRDKRNWLVCKHLRALMNFEQWQVRHAGLLSLKHILANVSDDSEIAGTLSDRVVELLSDGDEDVRSVAADVLCSLLTSGRQASINLQRTFETLKGLLQGLDELSPSVAPILDLLGQLVVLNSSFGVESELLIPFLRHASTKVRKQVIKVLGAMNISENEDIKMVLVQLIQSMAVEVDREISDLTLVLSQDLITIAGQCNLSPTTLKNLLEIAACPLGFPYSLSNFNFSSGPAGHDLAFKKSDMMLINEEEAIVQRMNVSLTIGSILKSHAIGDKEIDTLKLQHKDKLVKSHWCIHHLVHFWIFGFDNCSISSEKNNFNELNALIGSAHLEFNRFSQIIGIGTKSSFDLGIVKNVVAEFNVRSEKSVEALNQLAVFENVLKQFEIENAKIKARYSVCHEEGQGVLLEALKLDNNSRLQEFYAKQLIKFLEGGVEKLIDSDLLMTLGEFVDLERLAVTALEGETGKGEVICVQRDWAAYNRSNDTIWRAGRFIFKEFTKSPVLVSKALANLLPNPPGQSEMNWLVGILNGITCKEIGALVVGKVTLESVEANLKSSNALECASAAFVLSQVIRLEIISTQSNSSKSLETFLHKFLFKSGAQQIFPIILELLNRTLLEEYGDVILMMVPVFLKRTLMEINDSDAMTRKFASLTFSQLVRIAPLAGGTRNFEILPETEQLIGECREFLDQLQGPSTALPDFIPPCPLNVQMRSYQQAGLNWLDFLRRFNLHGALCDDMGLGKTLQTLSIIASDHFEQRRRGCTAVIELRSLIICPSSLTGHWEAEVKQYCPTLESPLIYAGPAAIRHGQLNKKLGTSEVVITSYDILRSDSEYFTALQWNYCVLDEGHLIKNPKTKISAAVRGLKAKHRLILSGTPIQNNLLELWALFDFLLPGYLGSERDFTEKYSKPILILQHQQIISGTSSSSVSSLDSNALSKWTQKDFDEAEGKLQSLHKQVLPFILRRMKEDVLSDLPAKIIQDYKCPMSVIQKILYEDLLRGGNVRSEISKFVKEKFKEELKEGESFEQSVNESVSELVSEPVSELLSEPITESIISTTNNNNNANYNKPTHVFQVLQYLRKVCVHPSLVLTPNHPLLPEINEELLKGNLKMTDLAVAPKFQMLKDLLIECGLGISSGNGIEDSSISTEGNHRVLIFAQQKSTLDLIEEIVFKAHLPSISFLRLDGSVEGPARYPIVSKFNNDLTIDVLLLTTQVGGLGLNLTSADTVIFMDPDWNPMKDLQAMDRAHRLGQKRVVTVYRLLLQDTLEDRIMSLQRWKTKVASTIITQQNSEAVNHENLLELFEPEEEASYDGNEKEEAKLIRNVNKKQGKKGKGRTPTTDWHAEDDRDLAEREAEYQEQFKY